MRSPEVRLAETQLLRASAPEAAAAPNSLRPKKEDDEGASLELLLGIAPAPPPATTATAPAAATATARGGGEASDISVWGMVKDLKPRDPRAVKDEGASGYDRLPAAGGKNGNGAKERNRQAPHVGGRVAARHAITHVSCSSSNTSSSKPSKFFAASAATAAAARAGAAAKAAAAAAAAAARAAAGNTGSEDAGVAFALQSREDLEVTVSIQGQPRRPAPHTNSSSSSSSSSRDS
ncbi:hypothetical protein Emed_007437 [Eimeria media]